MTTMSDDDLELLWQRPWLRKLDSLVETIRDHRLPPDEPDAFDSELYEPDPFDIELYESCFLAFKAGFEVGVKYAEQNRAKPVGSADSDAFCSSAETFSATQDDERI